MSTRGTIARPANGTWEGREHHWDSYPAGLGQTLYKLYRGHFGRDFDKMVEYLIDAPHAQCGWSTINKCDFSLTPQYERTNPPLSADKNPEPPSCYAGRDGETPHMFGPEDADADFVYVFEKNNGLNLLWILANSAYIDHKLPSFAAFSLGDKWGVRACIDLDGPEPDWNLVGIDADEADVSDDEDAEPVISNNPAIAERLCCPS